MTPSVKLKTTDYLQTLAKAETFDDLEAMLAVVDDAYDRGDMTAHAVTTLARLIRERARQIDRRKNDRTASRRQTAQNADTCTRLIILPAWSL